MNAGKHIRSLIKEKKLTLVKVHERIVQGFGKKAITYRTLQRIIAGHTEGNDFSLYQICMGLGITLGDLRGSTADSEAALICRRRRDPQGLYFYNPDAYAEILTGPKSDFSAMLLILKPGGQTKLEKNTLHSTKWIFVQKGNLTGTIDGENYLLKKGDSLTFDSRLAHSFKNASSKTTTCLFIQIPPTKNSR